MPTKTRSSEVTTTPLPSFAEEEFVDPAIEQLEELKAFRETDEGKALVDWVKKAHKDMESSRSKEKQQWLLNLAMYNGQQNSRLATGMGTGTAGSLYAPPQDRKNDKRIINRIRSAIRTEQAKFLSQKPGATVVPASSEDEDLFAAMAGEQVWQSLVARKKLQQEYAKSVFWLSITGNGFMKVYWDVNAIDEDSNQPGDIAIESVNPFNLFVPDLREEDIEMQPYVLHMYVKTPTWVHFFYKEELDGIQVENTVTKSDSLLDDAYLKTDGGGNTRAKNAVMVYEMWIKPGGYKEMPHGGLVTIVGDTLVGYSPNGLPYDHGKYPFIHFGHVPSGKFYRTSIIDDLIELQRDYNENRTHIARARKRMGMPQILAQKGSVSATKWTNETGLMIEYKPGTPPPNVMPLAQLPSYITEETSQILADIEDLSGQHQVSKGSAPPGVTAATAISFLQEKDDSYLVPTYQSVEFGFEKLGRCGLSLAKQYWDVPRTIKVVGSDNSFDAYQFSGADIGSGVDLRVEAGSALPQSKAAKQAFIMDLMKMGFIPPEKGLEMLEIGGATKLLDQLQGDKKQAQRENVKMKTLLEEDVNAFHDEWEQLQQQGQGVDNDTGEPLDAPAVVPVNTFDNHEVHIDVHNQFRRSQAYEQLDDYIKEVFERHVSDHEIMAQQKMLQTMLSQIPTDGSVPGIMGNTPEEGMDDLEGGEPSGVSEMPDGEGMVPEDTTEPEAVI